MRLGINVPSLTCAVKRSPKTPMVLPVAKWTRLRLSREGEINVSDVVVHCVVLVCTCTFDRDTVLVMPGCVFSLAARIDPISPPS